MFDNIAEVEVSEYGMSDDTHSATTIDVKKPFWHKTISEFKLKNHARTDHIGRKDGNRCFDLCKLNNDKYFDMRQYEDLVKSMVKYFGSEFFLNEKPEDSAHRFYIDFDVSLSERSVENIVESLEAIIETPEVYQVAGIKPEILVARNEKSGKVHMIVNVGTYTEKPKKGVHTSIRRRAEMKYIREYLFDCVSHEISRDDWFRDGKGAIFDIAAPGIRSLYSVKVRDGELVSEYKYLPKEVSTLSEGVDVDQLLKYSIYQPAYCVWNEETRQMIDDYEPIIEKELLSKSEARKNMSKCKNEYCATKKTISVLGVDVPASQGLVDKFISVLRPEWATDKPNGLWTKVLSRVQAVAQLITKFDPDYFLHEWSKQYSPDEYDKHGNNRRFYKSAPVTCDEVGSALTWLRNKALINDRPAISKFINPMQGILDLDHPVYFVDYLKYCREYSSLNEMINIAGGFVKDTIAYIVNGGKPIYVTKNLVDGIVVYDFGTRVRSLGDKLYFPQEEGGKRKLINVRFGDFIEKMNAELYYDRINFIPHSSKNSNIVPKGIFNIFTKFAAAGVATSDFSAIQPAIDHISEILCAGDAVVFEYVKCWLAHLVQYPNKKMGVALLFKSQQGAGKNIIWEYIIKSIIGRRWATLVNDIEQIVGRFNSCIENKILTVCDEISNYGGAYKSNDKLKSLITGEMQKIERKGIDPIDMDDYNHFVFITNNQWAVRVEESDRRYVIVESSDSRVGDFEYFKSLAKVLSTENAGIFMEWLMSIDLTNWNHRAIPMTKLKQEMKMNSVAAPIQWLLSIIRGEDPRFIFGEKELYSTQVMYAAFKIWCDDRGIREVYTERQFSLQINKVSKTKQVRIEDKVVRRIVMNRDDLLQGVSQFTKIPVQELEDM